VICFFFQAEDGIRDRNVTGVQTCALPIFLGVALFKEFGLLGILFPLMARAFGLIASIAGILIVRTDEDKDPMSALNRGYAVTTEIGRASCRERVWRWVAVWVW